MFLDGVDHQHRQIVGVVGVSVDDGRVGILPPCLLNFAWDVLLVVCAALYEHRGDDDDFLCALLDSLFNALVHIQTAKLIMGHDDDGEVAYLFDPLG